MNLCRREKCGSCLGGFRRVQKAPHPLVQGLSQDCVSPSLSAPLCAEMGFDSEVISNVWIVAPLRPRSRPAPADLYFLVSGHSDHT